MQQQNTLNQIEISKFQSKQLEEDTQIDFSIIDTTYLTGFVSVQVKNTGNKAIDYLDAYIDGQYYNRTYLSICYNLTNYICGESGFGDYAFDNTLTMITFHFNNNSYFGESSTVVNNFGTQTMDGVANNVRFDQDSKFSHAATFNGLNSYIMVDDNGATIQYTNTLDYTWSFWIKPENLSGTQGIISKQAVNNGYAIQLRDGWLGMHAPATGTFDNSTKQLSKKWQHVAITHNNENISYYVNGEWLRTTTYSALTSSTNNANDTYIGRNLVMNYFNGSLDELQWFNTKLTEAQVQTLYQKGREVTNTLVWENPEYATLRYNITLLPGSHTVRMTTPHGLSKTFVFDST